MKIQDFRPQTERVRASIGTNEHGKDQARTRFLWADKRRRDTDASGRPTRRGSPKKRYITNAFSFPGGWQSLSDFLGMKGMRVDLFT